MHTALIYSMIASSIVLACVVVVAPPNHCYSIHGDVVAGIVNTAVATC